MKGSERATMHAMVFEGERGRLHARVRPRPRPGPHQVLLRVRTCGVCRTDLHLVDRELPEPRLPVIPGHEIVGVVEARGARVTQVPIGARLGVPWLAGTCGRCAWCRSGRENLCPRATFTGYQLDGGYADYALADARYCLPIPPRYGDAEAAPLLCAGLIGYRALLAAGDAKRLGIYGFGAAAHLVAQVARRQGREVYAFTRAGDTDAQALAKRLGARWAGGSDEPAPEPLDAALLFAPVGALVPAALRAIAPGGTVVCAGIHMSDIPSFPYAWLWGERSIRSVANLTRADGEAFMRIAGEFHLLTEVTERNLADAQRTLDELRAGKIVGAAVLRCSHAQAAEGRG